MPRYEDLNVTQLNVVSKIDLLTGARIYGGGSTYWIGNIAGTLGANLPTSDPGVAGALFLGVDNRVVVSDGSGTGT